MNINSSKKGQRISGHDFDCRTIYYIELDAEMLERSYGVASRIHAAILMRGDRR